MRLLLIPVSSEQVKAREMQLALQQAYDAARRIGKKTNLRRERVRFTLACEQIESVAQKQESDSIVGIDRADVETVFGVLPTVGGVRIPFIDRKAIRNRKHSRFRKLCEGIDVDGGLVAVADPFSECGQFQGNADTIAQLEEASPITPDYSSCEIRVGELSPKSAAWRTHKQIRNALETGRPIGWINVHESEASGGRLARHEVLVDALRDYVGSPSKGEDSSRNAANIHVAYPDGSVGDAIPLLCLEPIEAPAGLPSINAALISARHFEMDEIVEVSLMRNSEITEDGDTPIADQERFAFRKAMDFFEDGVKKLGGLEVRLFHTGLEPAVVGTYRAVIEFLRKPGNRGKFAVIPKVLAGKKYKDLRPWY